MSIKESDILQPFLIQEFPGNEQGVPFIESVRNTDLYRNSQHFQYGVIHFRPDVKWKLNYKKLFDIEKRGEIEDYGIPGLDKLGPYMKGLKMFGDSESGKVYKVTHNDETENNEFCEYKNVAQFIKFENSSPPLRSNYTMDDLNERHDFVMSFLREGMPKYLYDVSPTHACREFLTDEFSSPLNDMAENGHFVSGCSVPWFQIGQLATFTSMHTEDHWLLSINFNYGIRRNRESSEKVGNKMWVVILNEHRELFRKKVAEHAKKHSKQHKERGEANQCWVRKKVLYVPLETLRKWGISFKILIQAPGDVVVTLAGADHQVINLEFAISCSQNFITTDPEDWAVVKKFKECPCVTPLKPKPKTPMGRKRPKRITPKPKAKAPATSCWQFHHMIHDNLPAAIETYEKKHPNGPSKEVTELVNDFVARGQTIQVDSEHEHDDTEAEEEEMGNFVERSEQVDSEHEHDEAEEEEMGNADETDDESESETSVLEDSDDEEDDNEGEEAPTDNEQTDEDHDLSIEEDSDNDDDVMIAAEEVRPMEEFDFDEEMTSEGGEENTDYGTQDRVTRASVPADNDERSSDMEPFEVVACDSSQQKRSNKSDMEAGPSSQMKRKRKRGKSVTCDGCGRHFDRPDSAKLHKTAPSKETLHKNGTEKRKCPYSHWKDGPNGTRVRGCHCCPTVVFNFPEREVSLHVKSTDHQKNLRKYLITNR